MAQAISSLLWQQMCLTPGSPICFPNQEANGVPGLPLLWLGQFCPGRGSKHIQHQALLSVSQAEKWTGAPDLLLLWLRQFCPDCSSRYIRQEADRGAQALTGVLPGGTASAHFSLASAETGDAHGGIQSTTSKENTCVLHRGRALPA